MTYSIQDLTLQVLRQMRDESVTNLIDLRPRSPRPTRGSTRPTRLDQTHERLGHVESTLVELAGQHAFVSRYIRSLAARDRDLAADVDELRTRVDALERRTPG